jgi:P27 family predicted phage terminase small subunit
MPAHKKPIELKLLHGSRIRKDQSRKEVNLKGQPLKCPSWLKLNPLAQKEWKRVMDEFGHTGIIKAVDKASLEAYCMSYARWIEAERIIAKEGQTITFPVVTRSGNLSGYKTAKHPAVTIARDERAAMVKFAGLFGFAPSTRLPDLTNTDEPEEEEEDDASLFSPSKPKAV